MRSLLLTLFVLSISSCHAAKASEPSVTTEPFEYPIWFWNSPTVNNLPVAVGYAPTSQFRAESSVESATRDGLEQLAKHISVRIRGERIFLNQCQAQNFQEEVPCAAQQVTANKHKILAIHRTPTVTIIFLGLGNWATFPIRKGFRRKRCKSRFGSKHHHGKRVISTDMGIATRAIGRRAVGEPPSTMRGLISR